MGETTLRREHVVAYLQSYMYTRGELRRDSLINHYLPRLPLLRIEAEVSRPAMRLEINRQSSIPYVLCRTANRMS